MRHPSRNPQQPISPRPVEAYWDCKLSRFEGVLLVLVLVLSILFHLDPVLETGKGRPVLVTIAALSYLSPFTGFLFVGASSVLPFPDPGANELIRTEGITDETELGMSPSQIGFLVWIVMTFLRYQRMSLAGMGRLWPVLPWFVWVAVITRTNIFAPSDGYMKALEYAVMACQLANESKGQYLKCLIGLCLGAAFVTIAFWGSSLGLPIGVSNYGSLRGGMERIGSIRADAVMTWPPILMALAGVIGVVLTMASKASPVRAPRWVNVTGIVLFLGCFPPLISTMTHGGYAGGGILIISLLFSAFLFLEMGLLSGNAFNKVIVASGVTGVIILVLFLSNAFGVRERAATLLSSYSETAREDGLAASRTGVWRDSINTILQYPLIGLAGNHATETITSEYAEQGGYASHNCFFDVGRHVGIPGMLLFAFFFFFPVFQVFSTGNWPRYLPFLLFYLVMFIFFMTLSFWGYKTCWAFWMLMVMAVANSKVGRKIVKPRDFGKKGQLPPGL